VVEVVLHAVAKEQFVSEYLLVAGENGLAGDIDLRAWVGLSCGCARSFHRWSYRQSMREALAGKDSRFVEG